MKSLFKITIIFLSLTIFALNFNYINAQIPNSIDGITFKVDPENPSPGEKVEVGIESYSIDLSSASIVWTINNKTYDKGIGLAKINIIAPAVGVQLKVIVIINTSQGREIQKSILIKSNYVDMIWEPLGYVPPFFEGKLGFAYQNTVRIIAIPHFSKDGKVEIDPKTLVYKWKRDGKYIDNGQGYDKQSVVIQASDIPKPIEVSVEVYTRDQSENTIGKISIAPSEPSLNFYEEDSLYGIFFNKALVGKIPLKNSEMKIKAIPYGFNMSNIKDASSFVWSINNIEQPDFIKNQSIVIRSSGEEEGNSSIRLEVRNLEDILQSASSEFTVYFNKKDSSTKSITF